VLVLCCVIKVSSTSLPPCTPSEYFLPWEVSNAGGVLVSSIPIDTGNILKGYLSLTTSRFKQQFVSEEVKGGMAIIEEKIQSLYVECVSLLLRQYYDFLSGHDWTIPVPLANGLKYEEEVAFEALGDHLDWLTSIANDSYRVCDVLLGIDSELSARAHALTSTAAVKQMESLREICSKDMSRTINLSLEFLSCIIFKSFEGVVPTVSIFDSWSTNTSMVEKFIEECMWYLQSRFEFLEKPCQIILLEICLKKVVAWYLYFLKECSDNVKIKFTDDHYMRIHEDVMLIVDAFSEQNDLLLSQEVVQDNRIAHELKRFQQIFVLLTEPIGSVSYTMAVCTILDDVKQYPAEGKAMSSCMKSIFKLTQRNADYVCGTINKYGVHPEQYMQTMTSEVTAAAATLHTKENRKLFSLGAYVLVFEAHVKPTDYFIHSATYVMKRSAEEKKNESVVKQPEVKRSSIFQVKKFLHL
jgi:hypothetical protein